MSGPDLNLLARIAPGILWVALLLAALLSLGRMFEADLEDGSLEVLATGPLPLEVVAAAKSLAHWMTTGLPLTALAPVLQKAMDAGIKVVFIDTKGQNEGVTFIGTNNEAGAKLAADYMCKNLKAGDKVAILQGIITQSTGKAVDGRGIDWCP